MNTLDGKSVLTLRQAKAEALLRLSLACDQPLVMLSNIIYDAGQDGLVVPDGEGGYETIDNGFDSDDLAIVLLPLLEAQIDAPEATP